MRMIEAHSVIGRIRGEVQLIVDRAAAAGANLKELLRTPEFRQALRASHPALHERRIAERLLIG